MMIHNNISNKRGEQNMHVISLPIKVLNSLLQMKSIITMVKIMNYENTLYYIFYNII